MVDRHHNQAPYEVEVADIAERLREFFRRHAPASDVSMHPGVFRSLAESVIIARTGEQKDPSIIKVSPKLATAAGCDKTRRVTKRRKPKMTKVEIAAASLIRALEGERAQLRAEFSRKDKKEKEDGSPDRRPPNVHDLRADMKKMRDDLWRDLPDEIKNDPIKSVDARKKHARQAREIIYEYSRTCLRIEEEEYERRIELVKAATPPALLPTPAVFFADKLLSEFRAVNKYLDDYEIEGEKGLITKADIEIDNGRPQDAAIEACVEGVNRLKKLPRLSLTFGKNGLFVAVVCEMLRLSNVELEPDAVEKQIRRALDPSRERKKRKPKKAKPPPTDEKNKNQ